MNDSEKEKWRTRRATKSEEGGKKSKNERRKDIGRL